MEHGTEEQYDGNYLETHQESEAVRHTIARNIPNDGLPDTGSRFCT